MEIDQQSVSSKFSIKDYKTEHEENVLTWHNVSVKSPKKLNLKNCKYQYTGNNINIIENITGYAKSGNLTALMGPSGSGKTTLLNFLANRLGSLFGKSGFVLLNGEPTKIKQKACYIKQEDIFYNFTTVEEHLIFNATLRIGKKKSKKEIKEIVDKYLCKFEMSEKRNTRITPTDSTVKGLSGGQRRRITIMTELMTDPLIIFADEPTTGLDSYMADSVVKILKDLANDGHIVICTIHQPTSLSLSYFDDLVLISRGMPMYVGALSECSDFLTKIGHECPENFSLSDHFIRLVSIEPLNIEGSIQRIYDIHRDFNNNYPESYQKMITNKENPYKEKKTSTKDKLKSLFTPHSYPSTWYTQFQLLLIRSFMTLIRQPGLIFYRMLQEVIVGFVIGIVYTSAAMTAGYAPYYPGLMFFETTAFSLNAVIAATISIPNEFNLFTKEHMSRIYPSGLYFLAKTIGELPFQILQSLLVTIFIYFLGNLRQDVGSFFLHFIVLTLSYQTALSFGYLISCIAGNTTSAVVLSTPFLLPFLLYGGFLLRESAIPVYFIWIRWISWSIYTFESFMIINFKGVLLPCDFGPCLRTGDKLYPGENLMSGYVTRPDFFVPNIILFFVLIIVYRVIAVGILVLKIRHRAKTDQF